MTSQIAKKKKKRSINRELFVGGGAIFLMLPLITLAVIGAFSGFLLSFALLSFSEVTAITALTISLTYGFFTLVFGVIFWRVMQRIRLLFQRKHDLKVEQNRVAEFVDTASAEHRLKAHNLESDIHFYDESNNKKEEINQS